MTFENADTFSNVSALDINYREALWRVLLRMPMPILEIGVGDVRSAYLVFLVHHAQPGAVQG